jgi:hypothetical protein
MTCKSALGNTLFIEKLPGGTPKLFYSGLNFSSTKEKPAGERRIYPTKGRYTRHDRLFSQFRKNSRIVRLAMVSAASLGVSRRIIHAMSARPNEVHDCN